MRLIHSLAAVALLVTSAAPALATPRKTPEEKLAKILEGRVAGEPVSCITTHNVRNTRIIEKTAIVYEAGSTIYVNRPEHADTLSNWDVMVTKPTNSQLCDVDIVQLYDQGTRMQNGFVGLGKFVPYTRVKTARR